MGLDIYVGDKWALGTTYSGFNAWRDHLDTIVGVISYDPDQIRRRNPYGYWDRTPEEPLAVLMIHHDNAGYIFPEQAKALKTRIEEILPQVDKEWKPRTKRFIEALSASIETGMPLEFH